MCCRRLTPQRLRTCSSAVKNNSLRFVIALLALVLGTALEELLPKFLAVGFPLLLAAVPVFAVQRPLMLPIVFSLAAGGAEDAISGLPFMTSASFFLLIAALVRWTHLVYPIAFVAYPAYQLWLGLWLIGLKGSVCIRVLLAMPIGIVTFLAMAWAVVALERKAGVDEAG